MAQVSVRTELLGLPGGKGSACLVVKDPPANTGDGGWIPGPGRSHRLLGQLSLCARTTEPVLLTTELKCPRAHAPQQEKPPH